MSALLTFGIPRSPRCAVRHDFAGQSRRHRGALMDLSRNGLTFHRGAVFSGTCHAAIFVPAHHGFKIDAPVVTRLSRSACAFAASLSA